MCECPGTPGFSGCQWSKLSDHSGECRSASALFFIPSIAFILGFTTAHIAVWKSLVVLPVQD